MVPLNTLPGTEWSCLLRHVEQENEQLTLLCFPWAKTPSPSHQLPSQTLATLPSSHNTVLVGNPVCRKHSFSTGQQQPGPTVGRVRVELLDHRDQRGGASTFYSPARELLRQTIPRGGMRSDVAEVWDNKSFHNGVLLSSHLLLYLCF